MKNYEQLRYLQQLYDDGILSTEFLVQRNTMSLRTEGGHNLLTQSCCASNKGRV